MENEALVKVLLEAFGEISAIFMSQEKKGTEIEMPSEELIRIANETAGKIMINTAL